MYSSRSSLPFGIKPAGLGAALIVNGAMMTALYLFIAPSIATMIESPPLIGRMIKEPPPPPPVDQPKPEERKVSREHPIVAPEPVIKTVTDDNPIKTTTEIVDRPPVIDMGTTRGEDAVTVEPPKPPIPPLIAAQVDPRYAASFQPNYPPSELRNERDGTVSVRVLIGTDGRVKAVEQMSATSAAFFEATRKRALDKWRFKPAMRGGTAQETWKVMNVRFTITDQR
jgi:protein TonB